MVAYKAEKISISLYTSLYTLPFHMPSSLTNPPRVVLATRNWYVIVILTLLKSSPRNETVCHLDKPQLRKHQLGVEQFTVCMHVCVQKFACHALPRRLDRLAYTSFSPGQKLTCSVLGTWIRWRALPNHADTIV